MPAEPGIPGSYRMRTYAGYDDAYVMPVVRSLIGVNMAHRPARSTSIERPSHPVGGREGRLVTRRAPLSQAIAPAAPRT